MVKVAYEDEWLLIVDKPAGLLVIPTPKNERHTLTNILNVGAPLVGAQKNRAGTRPAPTRNHGGHYRLYPCHRIDRDTSGLIIYAKGKSTQKKMMEEFKNRRVKKTYVAFVQGRLARPQGQIAFTIDGSSALTRYKVIDEKKGFTVVEVTPVTGRKNQIRLHFKRLGHPILGETRFAFRRDFKVKAKRLCLHAKSLEFMHPVAGKLVKIESELPGKMEEMLC